MAENHLKSYVFEDDGSNGCTFENGRFLPDKEVWKLAEKRLCLFDWLFNHEKVTNEIMWSHAILAEKVANLPKKES